MNKKTERLLALLLVSFFVTRVEKINATVATGDDINVVEKTVDTGNHKDKHIMIIKAPSKERPGVERFYAVEMHKKITDALHEAENLNSGISGIFGFLDEHNNNNPTFFRAYKNSNSQQVTYTRAFPPLLDNHSTNIMDAIEKTPIERILRTKLANRQDFAPYKAKAVLEVDKNEKVVINKINSQNTNKNVVIIKSKSQFRPDNEMFFGLEVHSQAEVENSHQESLFAFEDADGALKFVRKDEDGKYTEPFPPFNKKTTLDEAAKAADDTNTIRYHKKATDSGFTVGEPTQSFLLAHPAPPLPPAPADPAAVYGRQKALSLSGTSPQIKTALDAYKKFAEKQNDPDEPNKKYKLDSAFEDAVLQLDATPTNEDLPKDLDEKLKMLRKMPGDEVLISNLQEAVISRLKTGASAVDVPPHWENPGWKKIIEDYSDERATARTLKEALEKMMRGLKTVTPEQGRALRTAVEALYKQLPTITYDANRRKKVTYAQKAEEYVFGLGVALGDLPLLNDSAARALFNKNLQELEQAMNKHFKDTGLQMGTDNFSKVIYDIHMDRLKQAIKALSKITSTHLAAQNEANKVFNFNLGNKASYADLVKIIKKIKMYSDDSNDTKLKNLYIAAKNFAVTKIYSMSVSKGLARERDAAVDAITRPENAALARAIKVAKLTQFTRSANVANRKKALNLAVRIMRDAHITRLNRESKATEYYNLLKQNEGQHKEAMVKRFLGLRGTRKQSTLEIRLQNTNDHLLALQKQHEELATEFEAIVTHEGDADEKKTRNRVRRRSIALIAEEIAQRHAKLLANRDDIKTILDKKNIKRSKTLDALDDSAGVDGAAPARRRTLTLDEYNAQQQAKIRYEEFIGTTARGSAEKTAHRNLIRLLDANRSTPAEVYETARKVMEKYLKEHRIANDKDIENALSHTLAKATQDTASRTALRNKAKAQRDEAVTAFKQAQGELTRALNRLHPEPPRVAVAQPSRVAVAQPPRVAVAQPPRAPFAQPSRAPFAQPSKAPRQLPHTVHTAF